MNQDFNFLFQLLKKENINIDKTEFQFQYQSHPDYPSLLAIVDTLTFFDIENNAIKKDFDEIKDLPEYFVALLNEDKSKPTLYLIQKNELDYYKYVNNTFIKIDISDLQKKWKGIVLLISKSSSGAFKTNKPTNLLLFGLVVVILMVQLFISASPIMGKLFLMLPFIGILFSIAALKDLFENKSKIISSICNMSASASCSSVTKASKWKFFEYVNFSDLSITFFSSQFVVLCFSYF